MPLQLVHLQRKPHPAQFSIEGYFDRVRGCLVNAGLPVTLIVLPSFSTGVLNRLRNLFAASRHRQQLCHVTGDIQYAALLLRRDRTVLTVLDCEILHRLHGLRRWILKLLWYTLPLRKASRVTVISQETRRQLLLEANFPEDRIHVIPVSVSPLFVPTSHVFRSQCPRILQVGTKANKNVDRLVQALQGIPCHLDIVGPVSEHLRSLLQQCKIQHTIWGRLTEQQLVQRYQQADILAFVSTHEGFGMPIVEAQCVERVCITSNCSSMPEVAGEGACLVDPFDVQSIRDGFQKVIRDAEYRDQLIAAGRINRQRFDAEAIARQFLKVYQLVAEEAGLQLNATPPSASVQNYAESVARPGTVQGPASDSVR
jgi:glycosyltransferase involved in cell wall biosynthesis